MAEYVRREIAIPVNRRCTPSRKVPWGWIFRFFLPAQTRETEMHLKHGSIQATHAGRLTALVGTWASGGAKTMAALLLSAIAWTAPVSAQVEAVALTDTSCAGSRNNNSPLGCQAGEFVVNAVVQNAPGSLPTCTIGGEAEIDVIVDLSGSNADRQDIGLFVGQTGNDPRQVGGVCSVATFPTGPLPWKDND